MPRVKIILQPPPTNAFLSPVPSIALLHIDSGQLAYTAAWHFVISWHYVVILLKTINFYSILCWFAGVELCEAFSLFDKDGDGQITVDEVAQTMASLGIDVRLSDIEIMVHQVDTDGQNV